MSDLPTIRIQGDQQLGRQYIPAARARLDRLREMLSHRGVAVGGDHGPLADGVYCYIKIAGGVSVIQILAEPKPEPPPVFQDVMRIKYPDFLSGVVVSPAYIDDNVLSSFIPTAETAAKHELSLATQSSRRLAVKPYTGLADTISGPEGSFGEASQYFKLRPGMYSGTMRKLVQFLMGYGRLPEESIYKDRVGIPSDDYSYPMDSSYLREIKREGVQIRYDFRFHRTHGIVQASDGKWWLVQIAQGKGVHIMPLKLYPETTDPGFREMLVERADREALAVIDLFGGFPTGESIPANPLTLDSYVRAGLIIKLADSNDLAAFYSCDYYSSGCGWAFNENGTEAHNTAFYVAEDHVKRGVHYAIGISVGKTPEIDPPGAAERLKKFIARGAKEIGLLSPLQAKCDFLTDDQIADLMRAASSVEAAQLLDEIELPPLVPASAAVRKQDEGVIFWPAARSPAFKVHEPVLDKLISLDMRPELSGSSQVDTRCNTTLYVFFSGMDLHKVKYYLNPGQQSSTSKVFGEQECQFIGEWGHQTESTDNTPRPFFYTSDIDNREVFPATLSLSKSSGVDIGYVACLYGDYPFRPSEGEVSRTKAFRITTEVNRYDTKTKVAAIMIPANDREAYYYFERNQLSGSYHSISVGYAELGDPNIYTYGRYFGGYPDATPKGCGTRSTFRRVNELIKADRPCAELADEGPWLQKCQQVEPLAFRIPLVTPPAIIETEDYATTIVGRLVCSGRSSIETINFRTTGPDAPFVGDSYFAMTPGEVYYQGIFINRNCFGTTNALFYNPTVNAGYYESVDAQSVSNGVFIGVCND